MTEVASKKTKIAHLFKEYWRVLRLTKKPNMTEFKAVVKVSSLGIAVIGLLGFIIHMIRQLVF
jgi:protein translocase SEC61 complex gamma subunit